MKPNGDAWIVRRRTIAGRAGLIQAHHRDAELELAEAAKLYLREDNRALAARFFDQFERIADLLIENPGVGTETEESRRWHPLSGFPYSAIYKPIDSGIRILVLREQNRDPGFGEFRR